MKLKMICKCSPTMPSTKFGELRIRFHGHSDVFSVNIFTPFLARIHQI